MQLMSWNPEAAPSLSSIPKLQKCWRKHTSEEDTGSCSVNKIWETNCERWTSAVGRLYIHWPRFLFLVLLSGRLVGGVGVAIPQSWQRSSKRNAGCTDAASLYFLSPLVPGACWYVTPDYSRRSYLTLSTSTAPQPRLRFFPSASEAKSLPQKRAAQHLSGMSKKTTFA